MIPAPGIFVGRVVHSRLRPRRHRLSYACYWLLLDLDDLEPTARLLRFFSMERLNLFSLRNADHGTGTHVSFRDQAEAQLKRAGLTLDGGRILLLTMPRILGYGFNPLSIYFCYARDGALMANIYEVHNTFGQRHSYLIPAKARGGHVTHACDKKFYVSPFLDMDLAYAFDVTEPRENVRVAIRVTDVEGPVLSASLAGERRPLTDRNLLICFATHPLLTVKVVAAIHWEALRLWWKGVPLVTRPPAPANPVTILPAEPLSSAINE